MKDTFQKSRLHSKGWREPTLECGTPARTGNDGRSVGSASNHRRFTPGSSRHLR